MSLLEEFLSHYQGRAASTRTLYRTWAVRFERHCQCLGIEPQDCQREQVEAYFQGLLWRVGPQGLLSSNTVYLAQRTVSRFFWWAVKNGHLERHPYPDPIARPVQPVQHQLSQEQVWNLFNLPDLSTPQGLRNLLLLEMIYELGWSIARCIEQGVEWEEALEPVASTWRRYKEKARPLLARTDTSTLLVTHRGQPFISLNGPGHLLWSYGRALNLPFALTASTLHRTQKELGEKGARRRLALNP